MRMVKQLQKYFLHSLGDIMCFTNKLGVKWEELWQYLPFSTNKVVNNIVPVGNLKLKVLLMKSRKIYNEAESVVSDVKKNI
jgi:hypothetical protein